MMPTQPPPVPPTPEQLALLDKPSWEEVLGLLKDKAHRNFRIDIETDSTIAGSLESDMAGIAQVLQAVGGFMQQSMPLVQNGMLPIDAQKEILMTITRRARMGNAVEDSLDKMQPPTPPQPHQDPAVMIAQKKIEADAQKFQAQQQADAQKAQSDQQAEAMKMQMQQQFDAQAKQLDMQIEQQRNAMEAQDRERDRQAQMQVEAHKQEMQAQQIQHQNQLEAQRDQLKSQQDAALEQIRVQSDERMHMLENQFAQMIAGQNNATKIEVAEIAAQTAITSQQISSAQSAEDASDGEE